ncbi:hypothetical protein [Flavicella sp.]|uniref:hypothetical protein n=1 Tax=Flavicella sp. TaxID=2957742 RepID=UPI0030194AEE
MKNQLLICVHCLFVSLGVVGQSDVSSPYSLFGVGKDNSNYFGGSNGLGNTGIGYSNSLSLNKINPASLTAIKGGTFLYDLGISSTLSYKEDKNNSQSNFDFNFTHIAMGFSTGRFWKMSFGLVPRTKTSYQVVFANQVEGSSTPYYTNIDGSGGISEVFWGHGLKVTENLSLGIELLSYFGSVSQVRTIYYETTVISLDQRDNYSGLGLKGSLQYTIPNLLGGRTTVGLIANLPSELKGTQTVSGTKTFSDSGYLIIEETEEDIDDMNFPLKLGMGISTQLKSVTFNLDYQKNYWSDSYISNENFEYRDQQVFGFGVEYNHESKKSNYPKNTAFRFGVNYDSGYLRLSDSKIDNYSVSLGLGLPISKTGSSLNFSYSYGKEGTLNNNLVIDNYHKFTLNISQVGNWFIKRKIF